MIPGKNASPRNSGFGDYSLRCHCGRIRATFRCSCDEVTVWECNCSDCSMRGNVHFIVPAHHFWLLLSNEDWKLASSLYEWGTKQAQRRFCKTCGILPFYRPRSNPDGVAITLACAKFGDDGPNIVRKHFDGINWEQAFGTSTIMGQSKPHQLPTVEKP